MNTIQRLLRHLTFPSFHARRLFPDDTLQEIETTIATGEKQHGAEIRVIIEKALSIPDILNRKTPRTRALELFGHHRIWETEENNGILVYINLADHKVEIVTDRGISEKIGSEQWKTVCEAMTRHFVDKHYREGVIEALNRMNALLKVNFPPDSGRINALPDSPLLL